jgi:hypothetical protein
MLKVKFKKVIVVIPGGTNPQIETLLNHLSHEVNYFDECHLWLNTFHKGNIDYMIHISKKYKFVKCVPVDFKMQHAIEGIGLFTNRCINDNIYIRLDNDICFIEKNAIKKLVNYRIRNKDLFLVYGNILNNPFTFHMYQTRGIIDFKAHFALSYHNAGRDSCNFMLKIHDKFLNKPDPELYHFPHYKYSSHDFAVPVNAICWYGTALKNFGPIQGNEERFLVSRPAINGVCGDALFNHLSYASQRINCGKNHNFYDHLVQRYLQLSRNNTQHPITIG